MKKASILFILLIAGVWFIAGCGEKKEAAKVTQAIDKPIEAKPIAEAPLQVAAPAPTATPAPAVATQPATPAPAPAASVKPVAQAPVPAATADMSAKGADIFKSKCMACHGAGGKGSPMAPAFAGNDWVKSASKEEIAGVIKKGRQGTAKRYKEFVMAMPSNAGLSDGDLAALADYIKGVSKN